MKFLYLVISISHFSLLIISFHGTCQGIAQQDDWFSNSNSIKYITIPKNVTIIENIICYKGPDCSGIP